MFKGVGMIFILIILFFVVIHNRIVNLKNGVRSAFSTIDVYLKKRYDLIPNLVNMTKSHMAYEQETLERLVALRNAAYQGGFSGDMEEKIHREDALTRNIGKIMALSENYPDLKASESFQSLSDALIDLEAEIGAGRRAYNAAVHRYNVAIEQFPASIVAKLFSHGPYPYFELEESQRENVKVEL